MFSVLLQSCLRCFLHFPWLFNFPGSLHHLTHQLSNLLSPPPLPVNHFTHSSTLSPPILNQRRAFFFLESWRFSSLSSAGSWWRLCETRCWKWCRWRGWRHCWGIPARWRRCIVRVRYSSSCSGPSARGSGRKAASRWWTHLGDRDRKWIRGGVFAGF